MNSIDFTTLDEKFAQYQTWLLEQPLSKHTKRAYQSRIRQFLKFMGQMHSSTLASPESPVSRQAVLAYITFLKTTLGAEPTSVNNSLTAIDHFCQFLGMEPSNVRRERALTVMPRTLTTEEQQRFLEAVEGRRSTRDRAMAFLFFYAGIRPGECAALNVADVADDCKTVFVQGSSHREVQLNALTTAALEAWLKERIKTVGDPSECALFVNAQGSRLSTAGIDLVIRGIGWTAKLDLSAQVLRHTCLKNLANSGQDLMSLAQLAGHKSLDTTRRYCPQSDSAENSKSVETLATA